MVLRKCFGFSMVFAVAGLALAGGVYAAGGSQVTVQETVDYRYITANGLPDHSTGEFPNRGNPHRISAQSYEFRMPMYPVLSGETEWVERALFGVAVNGVAFDPGTAECFGQARGSRPMRDCAWREEAIVGTKGKLGLDRQNAHVQPSGAYHYHGMPSAILQHHQKTTMVGYAADGFPIYAAPWTDQKPSYELKEGMRPIGEGSPGGKYDGTYTQDFEYVAGSGTLDECNGQVDVVTKQYRYYVTESFPFVPRCWRGVPDPSFDHKRPSARRGGRY